MYGSAHCKNKRMRELNCISFPIHLVRSSSGLTGVYLQGIRGKPGRLSLKPLSHMAQLSVANDHSPTTIGPKLASIYDKREILVSEQSKISDRNSYSNYPLLTCAMTSFCRHASVKKPIFESGSRHA